jgi:hypothetical protein
VPTVIAFIACARDPFRLKVPRAIAIIVASTFGTRYINKYSIDSRC